MLKTKEPRVELFKETKLAGKRITMSFAANKTRALWQGFMPLKNKIDNSIGTELYSVEIYNSTDFVQHFNPNATFEKWACLRVSDFGEQPDGIEHLVIPEGLYAVFIYRGKASEALESYQYIYNTWLPNSNYELDNRPHFALMGNLYKNDNPSSEEELWIPIKEV